MKAVFEKTGTLEGLCKTIEVTCRQQNPGGLMILAGDANDFSADAMAGLLKKFGVPVFGGIFPQIIFDGKNYEKGCVVVSTQAVPEVICVKNLGDPNAAYEEQLAPFADKWGQPGKSNDETFIVFVDGLSCGISSLIQDMFYCFGLQRNYIGGGAGSLSLQQKPCLITPEGLLQDAAVIARLPLPCGTGVAHGWESISEGLKVTEAEGNVLQTLDWRPAFEVYRELVEAHSGLKFSESNFFEIAKSYPFGITRLDTEVIVRDPLMKNASNGLVCVGAIPPGSFVRLLHGRPESLIEAATRTRLLAESSAHGNIVSGNAFIIDCISRALFLGTRIEEELQAAGGKHSLFGALTLGEIANSGQDYLEFFNKTTVIGIFDDEIINNPG
ncbi:MAG TPA: FIST N-terminal domain-containing protein [Candidatus Rifleibacterium sp.]|jgi:hypothetical protein|nr:FIST N-terminal domain-containing protein [Candidatus Rifleibacterium sp.]